MKSASRRSRYGRPKRLAPLLLTCFLWLLAPGAGGASEVSPPSATPLRLDAAPVEAVLVAGETHLYRMPEAPYPVGPADPEAVGPYLLRIQNDDLSLRLSWTGPSGEPEWIESPVDRTWALLTPGQRIELTVAEGIERGSTTYELWVTAPGAGEGGGEDELRAARDAFEATRLEDRDAPVDEIVAHWERAVATWRGGGWDDAAHGVLALAEQVRRQGDGLRALELFREAWRALETTAPDAAADALDGVGLSLAAANRFDEAREAFEQALALRHRLGFPSGLTVTQSNLCYAFQLEGRLRPLIECYGRAADLARMAGERRMEAVILNNLGGVYERLGEPLEARDHYRRALEVMPEGDDALRAQVWTNLGVVHRRLGELGESVVQSTRALEYFRGRGDLGREARVLHNLAVAYFELGEKGVAENYYRRALERRRAQGNERWVASTLDGLGTVLLELEDVDGAVAAHREALALHHALGDTRGEAQSSSLLGEALRDLDPDRALELLRQGVEMALRVGDPGLEAALTGRLAGALEHTGRDEEAVDTWRRQLARLEDLPSPDLRLAAHQGLARLAARRGDPDAALVHAEASLTALETLRAAVPHTSLRATLLASQRRVFEIYLDILMDLDRRDPNAGHARHALEISERARARTLLDLVAESEVDHAASGDSTDGALRRRAEELQQRIQGKLERRLDPRTDADESARLERELSDLYLELERAELSLRHRSPAYDLLARPQPLTAEAIQALLPVGTTLLEYALGERRSFLWAVTRDEVTTYELPPRSVVDAAARRAHHLLSVRQAGEGNDLVSALDELSRLVLAPVAERIAVPSAAPGAPAPRLVIVPDGALHFIPFAVLPRPGVPAPLVESHEIAHLPSVTVLVAQQAHRPSRSAPSRLAVLADPVFTLTDDRLAPTGGTRHLARLDDPPRGDGSEGLDRLPGSRQEAEAISELLPVDGVWKALGFEARRRDVLDGRLAGFRFVHFATHGFVDSERPKASGLLLSRFDADGHPQDGFVSLADIYALDLDAELVVLSGCETALGRELRGEGLMGLTHGFLHAGAQRVMASLWRVQDRATAELMRHFYRSLLVDELPPAAALRQAQRTVRRNRRWRDPYYWAPFFLQGDWRPLPPGAAP